MSQTNRLGTDLPAEFSAPLIDRSRPVRFSLDGLRVEAFAGDTVLSALLANGIAGAGMQSGFVVALDEDSAPCVGVDGTEAEMPMALCPAVDGLALRTVGPRKASAPIRRLLTRKPQHLGHDLDAPRPPGGWIDADADETMTADLAIVGGGVAGMSAALAAAERGLSAVLVEREGALGGVAAFFGKVDGETPPEEAAASLIEAVSRHASITVLTHAEAFDLSQNQLRVLQVVIADGRPRPRHLAIGFSRAVLATGMDERLPVFAGNRLPGVIGALSLWRLARRYNVWPGETFHLHTSVNAGYRMAMLGSESGKSVHRASDPRPDPRTRFIEFCKAYGFRLGWGARIAAVRPERDGLSIKLDEPRFDNAGAEPVKADTLVVSGGWQPALGLWVRAGGDVIWDAERQRLVPEGTAGSVTLAGSAAGFLGTNACIESGRANVDAPARGPEQIIHDPQIDEIHESRDGPLVVAAPLVRGVPPAWLAPSRREALAEPPLRGIAALVTRQPARIAGETRAADLCDVAGMIVGGQLAPAQAKPYCRQWCIVPYAFRQPDLPTVDAPDSPGLPDYLIGRFGPGQSVWRLTTQDERVFDPGCLVFINTDDTHPQTAIGAILSGDGTGWQALMARTEFGAGDTVYVRDGAVCTPARLLKQL